MVSVVVKMNKILTSLILAIVFAAIALIVVFMLKTKKEIEPEKYLKSLGYEIEYISEKEVNIPENFGDGLKKYNELQKKQGFNLEKYSGKSCVQKQFYVTSNKSKKKSEKYVANVLTYKNKLIGGDLHSLNYEQEPKELNSAK